LVVRPSGYQMRKTPPTHLGVPRLQVPGVSLRRRRHHLGGVRASDRQYQWWWPVSSIVTS